MSRWGTAVAAWPGQQPPYQTQSAWKSGSQDEVHKILWYAMQYT